MFDTMTLAVSSMEETTRLAQKFGQFLGAGDVILLTGEIGAGKTHFARSLIQSLQDLPEDVPSPTFTLVQEYDTRSGPLWHADLYRLTDVGEVIELGLQEAFEEAICLVEWPDRLGDLAPPNAMEMTLSVSASEEARTIALRWSDPRWAAVVAAVSE